MPREEYRQQLDALRENVCDLSALVLDRLRQALTALDGGDGDLAREVVEGDAEINRRYLDLERDCIDLLALQQPVAGDLRFIAASFKILTDLERIADLAANLAGYALDLDRETYPDVDLQRVGALTVEMVEDAMAAYADDDVEACRAIAERDDEVDARCERASQRIVRDLLEREFDAGDTDDLLGDVSAFLLTIRDLERVGDHAVNVAARTLYAVENDDELIY
ncbi:phosphate transport system protein [Natronoarchaeum philippinense]|uniref:Phosphate-specific transport system accessory protein PhoU n=1 Tax=Natronoarchaeum philippinense TaxID=558529 RepID=A0A285PA66_NATPI|nr:phosphate signaling complex protein PhoU [Natronoarchaeum philippinense]SNZ18103.1 phosphate transport system protein [Natronoarchaeum philippinense]